MMMTTHFAFLLKLIFFFCHVCSFTVHNIVFYYCVVITYRVVCECVFVYICIPCAHFCLYTVWSPRAHLQVVGMLRFMSLTQTNRACPRFFLLFLCLFLSLWPLQLYFIPYILPTALLSHSVFLVLFPPH